MTHHRARSARPGGWLLARESTPNDGASAQDCHGGSKSIHGVGGAYGE